MPQQCALLCTISSRVTLLMKTTTTTPWQGCVGRLFNVWSPLQLWRLPIDFAPLASVVALRRHLQWEVPSSKVILICTYCQRDDVRMPKAMSVDACNATLGLTFPCDEFVGTIIERTKNANKFTRLQFDFDLRNRKHNSSCR